MKLLVRFLTRQQILLPKENVHAGFSPWLFAQHELLGAAGGVAQDALVVAALMSTELAQASLVEERMYVPAAFLGLVFLGLLITPPLLRLLAAS